MKKRSSTHSRRQAARHLMNLRQVQDSMTVAEQPSIRNSLLAGLQGGITAAIALPLVLLSAWPHLVGFASLGALVALFGRFAPRRDRNMIVFLCLTCQVTAVFSMSAVAWLGMSYTFQLCLLALSCGIFLFVGLVFGFGPPGPLIFVFAGAASMSDGLSFDQVIERTAATTAVALLALFICAATERFRYTHPSEAPGPGTPKLPIPHLLTMAGRASVGAGIAAFTSYLLGANHPAWAAMGALAVLQGTNLHINMNRALQRTAGTVVGAILAWGVLIQDPSAWVIISVLVGLQILTEIVIGYNYAIGQVLVTPMALLMTHLAAPQSAGAQMAPERVLDTVLGVAVGVGIAVLLSSIDDRRHLAKRHGRPDDARET